MLVVLKKFTVRCKGDAKPLLYAPVLSNPDLSQVKPGDYLLAQEIAYQVLQVAEDPNQTQYIFTVKEIYSHREQK